MNDIKVVLASGSPRRRELLQQIGISCEQRPPDIDESIAPGELAAAYTSRLAGEKLIAVPADDSDLVIAADTSIECQGEILGKPQSEADFQRMFSLMRGCWHSVWTSVAVRHNGHMQKSSCETRVLMHEPGDEWLLRYWQTGEARGKAGGYAIQGAGAMLIERIEGSYSNVVGLPLFETAQMLRKAGIELPPHAP